MACSGSEMLNFGKNLILKFELFKKRITTPSRIEITFIQSQSVTQFVNPSVYITTAEHLQMILHAIPNEAH